MLHEPNERPDLDAVRMRLMPDHDGGGYPTATLPGAQYQDNGGYSNGNQSGAHCLELV